MRMMKWGLAAIAAAVLVACGGGSDGGAGGPATSFSGGSAGGSKVSFSSVKVFGDSIADSGTFGFKFTVQNAANPAAGYPIWPELVAKNYGVTTVCPFFRASSATTFLPPVASCSSFSVGGARINNPASSGGATVPYSIPYQMQTALAAGVTYTANDLVLIDGGGNDAADLVGAFLKIPTDQGATFLGLVGTLVPQATIGAILGATPGTTQFATLGGAYMQALADKFAADIATNVTGKGATHVAILNMPDVTGTPRFQFVLGAIAQQSGAAQAAAVATMVDQWTQAFNQKLAGNVASNASVAVVDFYSSFKDELANPGNYALTNVKTPACPVVKIGTDGLPEYSFPTCTDTSLSATPPTGVTSADWWKSYAFSDSFHPTPFGHQLLAQYVGLALSKKGWL